MELVESSYLAMAPQSSLFKMEELDLWLYLLYASLDAYQWFLCVPSPF